MSWFALRQPAAPQPTALAEDAPRPVRVWDNGKVIAIQSSASLTANILDEAGILLNPGDTLLWNGTPVTLDATLPITQAVVLQVQRAWPVTIEDGQNSQVLTSNALTLGAALWEAGFTLNPSDRLSLPLDTPLNQPLTVQVVRAAPLVITTGNLTLTHWTTAQTIGAALAEAGLPLQGLDYSLPAAEEPLPANGSVRVVQVREETIVEQTPIPFETLTQPVEDLDLDQTQVIQTGSYGIQASRVRVRYEDGVEISRELEAEWQAAAPQPRILGYGTRITIRTADTADGPIEYWRAVTAFATSFSPCNLGIPNYCNNVMANGRPVTKGVAAVIRSWYNVMAGSSVYVPGYGTAVISDIGAGVSGRNWIDLGYTDEEWVPWARTVTIYFLTPVPPADRILWILP